MELYAGGDDAAFWAAYVANRMTPDQMKAYEAHKSGTMKLQPFYEQAMDDMASGLFERLTGEKPAGCKGIGSFQNLRTTLSKLMFDHDSTTHYTSGVSQQDGDWIGADLGCVRDVHEVAILQGRNSVDDVDFFDHALVEASVDGRQWTALGDSLRTVYDIRWTGEPVPARYVRLRRLESPRTHWASVRSFEVNPVRAERLGFGVEADDLTAALYAFDRNPSTSFLLDGALRFGVPAGAKGYTMLLQPDADAAPASVRQYAADGTLLSETHVDAPLFRLTLESGAARVELEGALRIFEIIAE